MHGLLAVHRLVRAENLKRRVNRFDLIKIGISADVAIDEPTHWSTHNTPPRGPHQTQSVKLSACILCKLLQIIPVRILPVCLSATRVMVDGDMWTLDDRVSLKVQRQKERLVLSNFKLRVPLCAT